LQTSAAANTVHSVQLYDNGQALGGVQTLTADGSSTLGVSLPAGIALAANVSHQLTAKLDGTPVNIGVVPPGGGVPGAYVPNLNVWVGTVSQMPVSLSAIATNTLYVIQDSAANLAALAASPIQTGAAISLAASGNLVFEVTDGQLTEFQQYLIEKSNLSILNFANQTVSDSLLGLEHAPVLAAGDALLAVDNIAHLLYSSAAIMTGFSAWSWSSGSYNLLGNAFGSGQVVLKDNLAHLLDSNNQAVLENSQTLQALNISTLKSMDVTDTVTNFQSPQFASEYSAIQTLANSLHTSFSLDVVDTLANLQAFLAGGGQFLATYAAHSAVIDNAANLEVAYANGSLSSLLSGLYTSSGHNAGIEVKDSVANLISLFNTPGEAGLYSRLSAVSVVDSAQNILSAFQNGKGSGFDPISIANNIVISDTYAHVLTASQSDPNLLAGVSTINITSAASTGNAALQINLDNSNSNGTNALALPEVVLSYMVGTLTATEVSDNNGGVLVTITDARSNSVSIDLIGVTDSGLSAYTHGGWYHI